MSGTSDYIPSPEVSLSDVLAILDTLEQAVNDHARGYTRAEQTLDIVRGYLPSCRRKVTSALSEITGGER